MPELPEVQTITTALVQAGLPGATVTGVRVLRADVLNVPAGALVRALGLARVSDVSRRGKHIVFRLGDRWTLVIHLGMTGQVRLVAPTEPLQTHTHLVLDFVGLNLQLRLRDARRFGFVYLSDARREAVAGPLAQLGPEPLVLTSRELAGILARSARPVKNVLTDQRKIAGIGNIYADEVLHRAGILPLRRADSLGPSRVARLHQAMREVLVEAIGHGGSSISDFLTPSGSMGYFQQHHRVYGRQGEPCRTCGRTVKRVVLAGRSTHFCSRCQR